MDSAPAAEWLDEQPSIGSLLQSFQTGERVLCALSTIVACCISCLRFSLLVFSHKKSSPPDWGVGA
jgi:hypothetical protein